MSEVTSPIILDSTGQSILIALGEIKDAIITDGDIVETNSNGTYVKFASGLMICYKTVTQNISYSAWGTLYESSIITLGNFPYPFKTDTTPVVIVNLNNSSSSAMNGAIANITNSNAGTVRVIRPNNPGSTSATVGVVAVGVWK
jgi:hypothetical protein